MIDRESLSCDILGKTTLSTKVIEKFVEENIVFFETLKDRIVNLNAYEAVEIISFLITAKKYFLSNQQWNDLIYACLVKIKEGIYDERFNTISSFTGITYVTYIIRELSDEIPELQRFLSAIELFQGRLLDCYLQFSDESDFYMQNGFELIQGMSGVLKYYLDGYKAYSDEIIDKIVVFLTRYSRRKIILGNTTPMFHHYISEHEKKYIEEYAVNGYVNYSVSHGMAGPLVALSMAYKRTSEKNKVIEILDGIIEEYMNSYYYIDSIIYWPGRISFEQYIGKEKLVLEKGRMSWCYGSVGILNSLYAVANEKDDVKLKEFCVSELKKIAALDTKDYLLNSPIVCHGLSGLIPVYVKMYEETHDSIFERKFKELLERVIYNFSYRYDENVNLEGLNHIQEYNYLEGYTGILQTIYSAINNVVNINYKRLLIY